MSVWSRWSTTGGIGQHSHFQVFGVRQISSAQQPPINPFKSVPVGKSSVVLLLTRGMPSMLTISANATCRNCTDEIQGSLQLLCLDIAADQQVIEAADAIPAVPVGFKHDPMLPVCVSLTMIF
jgi:hypothetical protein